jgi:UDP-perosamine 4-acetyltransferase
VSELVVLGTAGHARSCLDVVATTEMVVRGCVGSAPAGQLSAKYLGGDEVLPELLADGVTEALVAVGDNRTRRRLIADLLGLGFTLPPVVSRAAFVSPSATIAMGTVVMHHVVVGPYSVIGAGAIVNTGATVDHDARIGDFVHLAPGTHLAGDVTVGDGAFLGVGSSVVPGVVVGEWATVGAGATVIADVPSGVTVVGTPAKQRRKDT